MITIHYDFVDGTEVSYIQGKELKDNFTTNCLNFFNMNEQATDVIVLKQNGTKISRNNVQQHTNKQIRKEHDIYKMLISNSFTFI